MDRMARVVVPFYPHHVTQRGNRRQRRPPYGMSSAIRSQRSGSDALRTGRGRAQRRICAHGMMHWWRYDRCCRESPIGQRIYRTPKTAASGHASPRIPAQADRWVTSCSFVRSKNSRAVC